MKKLIISPSILSADFANIKEDLLSIKSSGAEWIHLDVMDGVFVPNITFGSKFINDIRKCSDLFFDTHLMICNPEKFIKNYVDAGSNSITIHYEACKNVTETLKLIKSFGCNAGLAINPETPVSEIFPFLDFVDIVLIMTVHPGFGGQTLIVDCLEKVKALNAIRGSRSYKISVDGGINLETAQMVKEAGVDVIVSGSSFFKSINRKEFVDILSSEI